MIAALFVQPRGCYFGLPHVDPWDEARDARTYGGSFRVVAHPPCARWGRYAEGSPLHGKVHRPGDDGGCFESALRSLRRWGGVLEHPADSKAWDHFGLNRPPHSGGWVNADFHGLWTCCVDQGSYGHVARKPTWLLFAGDLPPPLRWGHSGKTHSLERLSARQRAATPEPFRDLLLELAA